MYAFAQNIIKIRIIRSYPVIFKPYRIYSVLFILLFSQRLIGELIVYPSLLLSSLSSTIFKHLLLRNR